MRIAVIGLLLGSLCLAACDDSTDAIVVHLPEPTPLILRTVNGFGLPFIIVDSTGAQFRLELVSGSFLINTNRTFTTILRFRETRAFVIAFRSAVCTGTYTNSGNAFTFVSIGGSSDCARSFNGTAVSFDELSTTIRGFPATFTR
jgi:hypothetical protein